MVEIITGDKADVFKSLKQDTHIILAHGVNCMGRMGSGIAGQIANQYPDVKFSYDEKNNGPGWRLGDVQLHMINLSDHHYIANCATQYHYGYDGAEYVNYHAVDLVISQLANISQMSLYKIHMPWIGCGLAGGNRDKVKKLVDKHFGRNGNNSITIWDRR